MHFIHCQLFKLWLRRGPAPTWQASMCWLPKEPYPLWRGDEGGMGVGGREREKGREEEQGLVCKRKKNCDCWPPNRLFICRKKGSLFQKCKDLSIYFLFLKGFYHVVQSCVEVHIPWLHFSLCENYEWATTHLFIYLCRYGKLTLAPWTTQARALQVSYTPGQMF